MTKSRIVEKFLSSFETRMSKAEATRIYDNLISVILSELQEGDPLRISGLGTFSIVDCAEKKYRNPSTGEIVIAPAHKKLKFKSSKVLNDKINNKSNE